jgi:redox-sensitive bicupin YhaK (pirin superfamily)
VGPGKVEIQNQDSHFSTAQNRLRRKEKNGRLHKTLDAPGPDRIRFLLVSGKPLQEPVAW